VILAVALASVFVTGIAGASKGQGLVKINYMTSFGTGGTEAYAYVALEKGFFRDAGFDVSITPGAGTTSDAQFVSTGRMDYSPGDFATMVIGRANSGLPVKCVALIQQSLLSAFISRDSKGIRSWKDLEGRTLGTTPGAVSNVLFPYIAKRAGFDASKVTVVPVTPQSGRSLFASGKIDLLAQFVAAMPSLRALADGERLRALTVASVVPGMMGNCLMVSDDKLRTKPDEVKRFSQALMKGLYWSLDNPGAAGAILQKNVPLESYELAAKELRLMKRFSRTKVTDAKGLGYIDPKRVDATLSVVNNFFKPKTRLTRNDVFAPGFQLPPKPAKKK